MKDNKYSSGTLIGDYIKKCELAKHPLDQCQAGLLEIAVRDFLKHNKDPTIQATGLKHDDCTPFDIGSFLKMAKEKKLFHPHTLISMLQTYKYGEKGEGLTLADEDALDFYKLIARETEYKEYVTISREHGLNNLRLGTMSALHSYLQAKGLVEKSSDFPLPPSDRDTRVPKKRL